MSDATTGITAIGTVMVPVADQDRAIDFYVDKLGFEKASDVPFGDGDRWVEVVPPGSATRIALVPPRGSVQPGDQARIGLSTGDIDAVHATLRERGVDVDPEVMRMGDPVPPMFWFRDADANVLLVVQEA